MFHADSCLLNIWEQFGCHVFGSFALPSFEFHHLKFVIVFVGGDVGLARYLLLTVFEHVEFELALD